MDIYPCHRRRFDLQLSDDEAEHIFVVPVEVLFEWDGAQLNWSVEQYFIGRWRNPRDNPELVHLINHVLRNMLNDAELQTILEDHPEYVA
jgi:hypothetical protein